MHSADYLRGLHGIGLLLGVYLEDLEAPVTVAEWHRLFFSFSFYNYMHSFTTILFTTISTFDVGSA